MYIYIYIYIQNIPPIICQVYQVYVLVFLALCGCHLGGPGEAGVPFRKATKTRDVAMKKCGVYRFYHAKMVFLPGKIGS